MSTPSQREILQAFYQSWSDVREEDEAVLTQLLRRGVLTQPGGGVVSQFEKRFAAFAGAKHGVAFCNGTASLQAALWAVGVRAGDDVLMPDYGFHGMAAAVITLGARVVPCDIDPDSLTLSPRELQRARTERTRAVLVHNPWGFPADWKALRAAAGDLPLVSDASHAHGATYAGEPLGKWADVTCYSLGLNKLITGGELGCAVSDSAEIRDRLLVYGHVNRVPRDLQILDWHGNAVGPKLRPHPLAAALALAQLKRYPEKQQQLVATGTRVMQRLGRTGLRSQSAGWQADRVFWRWLVRLPEGLSSGDVAEGVRAAGLPMEPNLYDPLLQKQPIFQWPGQEEMVLPRECPAAAATSQTWLTFPSPVRLSEEIEEWFVATLSRVLSELGAKTSEGCQ